MECASECVCVCARTSVYESVCVCARGFIGLFFLRVSVYGSVQGEKRTCVHICARECVECVCPRFSSMWHLDISDP